jgi:hypothetical protein
LFFAHFTFWNQGSSSLIMTTFIPSSRISHFFKKPRFFLLENSKEYWLLKTKHTCLVECPRWRTSYYILKLLNNGAWEGIRGVTEGLNWPTLSTFTVGLHQEAPLSIDFGIKNERTVK